MPPIEFELSSSNKELILKIIKALKKKARKEVIMLFNGNTWKEREFLLVENLSFEDIEAAISRWRSVTFCTADPERLIRSFIEKLRKREEDKLLVLDETLPEKDQVLDIPLWLAKIPKYAYMNVGLSISGVHVRYKPFLMVDIDFKDQRELMRRTGLIDAFEFGELEEGINPRSSKIIHDTFSLERRLALATALIDIPKLVAETSPSLVMMSGGGVHLWYNMPSTETDRGRYALTHQHVCKKVQGLFPELNFDFGANMIQQNLRIPGSVNLKGMAVPCTALYSGDFIQCPSWIEDFHKDLLPGEHPTPNNRSKETKGANGEPMNLGGIIGAVKKLQERKVRRGLKNFKRDFRLWAFIRKYLSFASIIDYTMACTPNYTVHSFGDETAGVACPEIKEEDSADITLNEANQYISCSSPLRTDKKPSFLVFPKAMFCRDLGRNGLEIDFEELMFLLIIQAKKRLGIQGGTTRYEADYHCLICAFLAFYSVTKKTVLPMIDPDIHALYIAEQEKLGNKFTLAEKRKPKGSSYYQNLNNDLIDRLNYFSRNPEAEYKDFFVNMLESAPKIYYFYNPDTSSTSLLNSIVSLSLIYFINRLNLGIQVTTNRSYKLYVVDNGLHRDWDAYLATNTITGVDAEKSKTLIHDFLVKGNMTEAGTLPSNTPQLNLYILGQLLLIESLAKKLGTYVRDLSEDISKEYLTNAVCRIIESTSIVCSRIAPQDIHIDVLNGDRYIEFSNVFVLYDSEDISRIGEVVNKNQRDNLLRKSVIDLKIPHCYELNSQENTPLFDNYMDSMEYRENYFGACIKYFLGSMLYPPAGIPTRALLVWGRKGDNGKSVLGFMISGLLGKEYITWKDISDITATSDRGKNSRMSLLNSVVNITMDNQQNKIEGTFKTLVEGEAVQVRALYQEERDVELRTHFIINTNSLPRTWGETSPLMKRLLLLQVQKVIPEKDRIPDLGNKIAATEASLLWPKIIQWAKLFRQKGLEGFLDRTAIVKLGNDFMEHNDLYSFIREYVVWVEDASLGKPLNKSTFKRLYNLYREYTDRAGIRSDEVINEASIFIENLFKEQLPAEVREMGFDYRNSKVRGYEHLRIFVPMGVVGNPAPIDSYA